MTRIEWKRHFARLACGVLALLFGVAPPPAAGQVPDGPGVLERRLTPAPPRDPGSYAYSRGDYATALRHWSEAARRGDPVAQYNIGLLHAFGLGVEQDAAAAAEWYRRSAEQGYDRAQAVLGLYYATGVGVPRNVQEAVRWWRLAAAQGNADARFNLGMSYWSGEGVPQDFDAAAEQFRRSVPAGSDWGRAALGTRADGSTPDVPPANTGTPGTAATVDAGTAYRQALDAAERGDPVAQAQLGYFYAVGHGVGRNLAEAYMWNNLAAARLPPGPVRDAAVQNRNAAAAQISADEMLRAQQRGRGWMETFDRRR